MNSYGYQGGGGRGPRHGGRSYSDRGGRRGGGRFGGGYQGRDGRNQGPPKRGGPLAYKQVINCEEGPPPSKQNMSVKDIAGWWKSNNIFEASQDGNLRMYNAADWTCVATIPAGHVGSSGRGVEAVLVEGSFLFVGTEIQCPLIPKVTVGIVRAWNLDVPSAPPYDFVVSEHMPFSHSQCVTSLAVATDPTSGAAVLFSGGFEGLIRVWKFDTAANRFVCSGSLEGHVRGVTKLLVIDNILASASLDHTIRLWDVASLKCINLFSSATNGHTNVIVDMALYRTSPTERYLISGGLDSTVHVWNLQTSTHEYADKQDGAVTAVCVTADPANQPVLLVGLQDGKILVKELVNNLDVKCEIPPHNRFGHTNAVRRILPGPDNRFFTCGEDGKVRGWKWTNPLSSLQQY